MAGCWLVRAVGCFDDQLRAGPVDIGCALQQVGAPDAQPVQGGLGRAGVLIWVACDGWFGLRAHAGIVNGAGGGSGGGQQAAGGLGGCGRLTGPVGCFGGRLGGVLAEVEQGVDMVGKGGGEGAGYVHGVGQGPGGDHSRPALAAVRIRSRWAGVAGVVSRGQRQRDIARMRGEVLR